MRVTWAGTNDLIPTADFTAEKTGGLPGVDHVRNHAASPPKVGSDLRNFSRSDATMRVRLPSFLAGSWPADCLVDGIAPDMEPLHHLRDVEGSG